MNSFISLFGSSKSEGIWTAGELNQHHFPFLKYIAVDVRRQRVAFEPSGYFGNIGLWETLHEIDLPLLDFTLQFDAYRGVVCTYEFGDTVEGVPLSVMLLLLCDGAYTMTLLNGKTKMENRLHRTKFNLSQGGVRASSEIDGILNRLCAALTIKEGKCK